MNLYCSQQLKLISYYRVTLYIFKGKNPKKNINDAKETCLNDLNFPIICH